eukprot:TRINITY_DN4345_c0_g5_i2.p1 TRINITY_DN4345_c0_g5~~TRINITY_DN4345_c0_g5_i2.p1  ORF type:complete len:363 (+),score=74.85 TRINITY_DN4345_c0_g5_i2:84-1091(+)
MGTIKFFSMSVSETNPGTQRRPQRKPFQAKSLDLGSQLGLGFAKQPSGISRIRDALFHPCINKENFATPIKSPREVNLVRKPTHSRQTGSKSRFRDLASPMDYEQQTIPESNNECEQTAITQPQEGLKTLINSTGLESAYASIPVSYISAFSHIAEYATAQESKPMSSREETEKVDSLPISSGKKPPLARVRSARGQSACQVTQLLVKSEQYASVIEKQRPKNGELPENLRRMNENIEENLQKFERRLEQYEEFLTQKERMPLDLFLTHAKSALGENESLQSLKQIVQSLDSCNEELRALERENKRSKVSPFLLLTQRINLQSYDKLLILHKLSV